MSASGKGDDYRPVNLKKFNESYIRIFGDRDPMEFQKCLRGTWFDDLEQVGHCANREFCGDQRHTIDPNIKFDHVACFGTQSYDYKEIA